MFGQRDSHRLAQDRFHLRDGTEKTLNFDITAFYGFN